MVVAISKMHGREIMGRNHGQKLENNKTSIELGIMKEAVETATMR